MDGATGLTWDIIPTIGYGAFLFIVILLCYIGSLKEELKNK
jgi:hypothetical protein